MAHHITKQQVVAWSRRHKNDREVGTPGCETNCPFVHFLQDTYGIDVVFVGEANYQYNSSRYNRRIVKALPDWARHVISEVDATDDSYPITMGDFKTILKDVGVKG